MYLGVVSWLSPKVHWNFVFRKESFNVEYAFVWLIFVLALYVRCATHLITLKTWLHGSAFKSEMSDAKKILILCVLCILQACFQQHCLTSRDELCMQLFLKHGPNILCLHCAWALVVPGDGEKKWSLWGKNCLQPATWPGTANGQVLHANRQWDARALP